VAPGQAGHRLGCRRATKSFFGRVGTAIGPAASYQQEEAVIQTADRQEMKSPRSPGSSIRERLRHRRRRGHHDLYGISLQRSAAISKGRAGL